MTWDKSTYKYRRPQRANRAFRKHAIPMGTLVSATLKRHGIGSQVKAAMVVREGNLILDQIIEAKFRKDLRVLSCVHRTLNIVCRHSAAAPLANSMRLELQKLIEESIPDAIIEKVYVRIDPHALDHSADTLV